MKLSTFFDDINNNTWEYRDLESPDYISAIKLLYGVIDFVKVDVENKKILSCEINTANQIFNSILEGKPIDKFIENTPLQNGRASLYPEVEYSINSTQRSKLLYDIYCSPDVTQKFIKRFLEKYTKKIESVSAINLVPQMDKIAVEFNTSRDSLLDHIHNLDEKEIFNSLQNALEKNINIENNKKKESSNELDR